MNYSCAQKHTPTRQISFKYKNMNSSSAWTNITDTAWTVTCLSHSTHLFISQNITTVSAIQKYLYQQFTQNQLSKYSVAWKACSHIYIMDFLHTSSSTTFLEHLAQTMSNGKKHNPKGWLFYKPCSLATCEHRSQQWVQLPGRLHCYLHTYWEGKLAECPFCTEHRTTLSYHQLKPIQRELIPKLTHCITSPIILLHIMISLPLVLKIAGISRHSMCMLLLL